MNTDIKTILLNRLENPFTYSLTFLGKGYYSKDGQLWGLNEIRITKSKTSICLHLKRAKDVHNFENIAFIRSIPELRETINKMELKHPDFFQSFGEVTTY